MKISSALALLSLLSSSQPAFARSHIRMPLPDLTHDLAATCTYPDGTHPHRAGIHCYAPAQFAQAYGVDRLHQQGLTGRGQTIILLDAFGSPTLQADLDAFSDAYGLPRKTIQFIYPNGPYVNSLSKPDPSDPTKVVADPDKIGWATETTLDLEWAHALAPDAELVNVVTDVSETEGVAGLPELFRGLEFASQRYPRGIVSMSFGTGEETFTGEEVEELLRGSFHQIFARAAQAGMTMLASTGDNGTAGLNLAMTSMMGIRNTGYPASEPLVTAVGGTSLEAGWNWNPQGTMEEYLGCKAAQKAQLAADPAATVTPCAKDFLQSEDLAGGRRESVWNEPWALAAGGGGVSRVFGAPAYQASLPVSVQTTVGTSRAIPDISMNAAINGGVILYVGFQVPGSPVGSPWTSSGGTSAAAPEMAALVALAGQRASELLGKPVGIGSLNELLYPLGPQDFHDILPEAFGGDQQVAIADNGLYFSSLAFEVFGQASETPVLVPGYPVLSGYDFATGLGSPVADRWVEDIAQARVAREQPALP